MQNISKEIILGFLRENKDFLKETYGVISIGLLGSFARDEQNEESDIDLIVEMDEISFHKLAGLSIFLEDEFKRKIDMIRKRKSLSKSFLEHTKNETFYA